LIAAAFGVAAINLIAEQKSERLVTWQNHQVVSVPMTEAIAQYGAVNSDSTLVKTACGLGMCLGD
jgi:ATP-dependent phosphofructokinase / diphosphate-dependent phosphofructokinase